MNGHPRTHGGDGLLLQILDGDGHIVDVNQGRAAALSYPPEDILGRHFCDFIESGHCDTVSAFLHDLEDEGASRFLPIVLRDKTRNPVSALLIAQPLDANGGYACEIWTIDGMTQAMTRARLRTERNHADDVLMRTFTAITELLAKSTRISDFLRDLGLLMKAVSGFPRVIIEPPPKTATPNWLILLKDNLQRLHGPSKATGTMILDAARHAEVSADLAAEFGRDDGVALWFPDESMPTVRRHIFAVLPADRTLAKAWRAAAPLFARAIANALSYLTTWERQAGMLSTVHVRSVTDPLTRVFNRYKLEESLSSEERRARRYGSWFSVIMADIDHFKRVNDTHGHPVGDRVLEEVAARMQTSTRSTDVVGRWGARNS